MELLEKAREMMREETGVCYCVSQHCEVYQEGDEEKWEAILEWNWMVIERIMESRRKAEKPTRPSFLEATIYN